MRLVVKRNDWIAGACSNCRPLSPRCLSKALGFIAGMWDGARPYPAGVRDLKSPRLREASSRPDRVELGETLWTISWCSRWRLGEDVGLCDGDGRLPHIGC